MWLLMVVPSDDIEGKLVAQIPKCFQNLQNKVSHSHFNGKGIRSSLVGLYILRPMKIKINICNIFVWLL